MRSHPRLSDRIIRDQLGGVDMRSAVEYAFDGIPQAKNKDFSRAIKDSLW